jgi:hypothetical protein
MNVAVGTTQRPANPLGVFSVVCGVLGAALTGVLWLYQVRPSASALGAYGEEIAAGGQLREDLIVLAGLFGAVAIVSAFLSSLGGQAKPSALAAIVLGAVALTYPVLARLDVVHAPLPVLPFPLG